MVYILYLMCIMPMQIRHTIKPSKAKFPKINAQNIKFILN